MTFHPRLSSPTLSTLTLLLVLACGGSDTPEARLETAGESLEEARGDATDARSSLSEAKERVSAAEAELYEARKEVRRAEKHVLSAEARVERRATDVALFRRIQPRLLEAEALLQDAVTVRVNEGNVTLEGTVANDAARKSALEIARSTPGVSVVRDRLEVESEEAS